MRSRLSLLMAGLLLLAIPASAVTTRIKDIARVEGVRGNQLVGYGLVVGLEGTGDSKQTLFTVQSIANMLSRFGVTVPAGQVKVKNVAAVMITADLHAFSRTGDKIDVLVSSVGDARTLQGGTLLQTPLMGADQQVYAVAQGPLSIGGFSGGGGGGATVKNHPTVGRIPEGALVEKEVPMTITDSNGEQFSLSLREPDFSAAARVAQAVTATAGAKAWAEDGGRVKVEIPEKYRATPVSFLAMVGEVPVSIEPAAKVVLNERTGTIVIGGAVKLSTVAVAHGGLTVSVSTQPQVSQPAPVSDGKTVVTAKKDVKVTEDKASTILINSGDTIEDLIKALNTIKATPRDIIAILQAIKEAGGLQAELEVL